MFMTEFSAFPYNLYKQDQLLSTVSQVPEEANRAIGTNLTCFFHMPESKQFNAGQNGGNHPFRQTMLKIWIFQYRESVGSLYRHRQQPETLHPYQETPLILQAGRKFRSRLCL